MSLVALSRLLATEGRENATVALRGDEPVDFRQFRAAVGGVVARATAHRCAALVCRDSYAFCVGLFGLLHAGCEVVLPPNIQAGTLRSLRVHFDLIVDDAFIADTPPADATWAALDADRPSLVFFTSGSTGTPKRILKQVGQLEREVATLDNLWGQESGSGPTYSTVPHHHIYGLTFKMLWPLAVGRPFADETDELWEMLLGRLRPDATIVSSPAHLERLAGFCPLPSHARPARIFSAGAPLSLRAATDADAVLGRCPTEIFGSTETGAFATRAQTAEERPWRLLPGIQMRCDDDGRLALLSPYVSDSWYETSDLVEPTSDGFHFRGRTDRVVKIEGKRVSLVEVEQTLARLPWITAAATILLPDRPARLGAAVVLNEDGRQRLSEMGKFRFGAMLRKALMDTQEAAGRPRVWRFVTELPSPGAMGKRRDDDILALFGTMS